MSLLMVRVPMFFRDFVPSLFSSERCLRVLIERLPRFRDALAASSITPDPAGIAATFRAMPVETQKAQILGLALGTVDETAKKLFAMRWTYLFTTLDKPFITSETPVAFTHRLGAKTLVDHSQIDDPEVEITFPLSSTVTLGLLHGADGHGAGAVDEACAADLNTRVLSRSHDYIVCSAPSFPGDAALPKWAERPTISLVNRLVELTE